MKKLLLFVFALCLGCKSSSSLTADQHEYAIPVDTSKRPISNQKNKVYHFNGLSVRNDFPAARLNSMTQDNDSTYTANIWPENFPINPSPWYAFKLWSAFEHEIYLKLDYSNGAKHRYTPKLSQDGKHWTVLDSTLLDRNTDSTSAQLKLKVGRDTLWLAAQELQDHRRVGEWVQMMSQSALVTQKSAGKSKLGRDLYYLNLSKGSSAKKPAILVISRQHPPEVTGYLCMKSFVETIIEEGATNGFLEKYRVMVYPLMNPDGVDLGHYRHNAGGVDLNRDWSKYHQPEIAQVTSHMVRETMTSKNDVILGLDFHSTYRDVYYTPHESIERKIPEFTKAWLEKIRVAVGLDDINESPGKNLRPTSSAWFNRQFGATGITYEIGDDTPRDFIRTKGKESARAMMELLLAE
ncbi:MAG: M14 family metallopeptidase [Maribacter sp.]|uniref:M14 family metallopeptidase n=1 Tax=Maribacter sp. TaxID=1897614 RepID=UPI003299668F